MPNQNQNPYGTPNSNSFDPSSYYDNALSSSASPHMQGFNGYTGAGDQRSANNAVTQSMGGSNGGGGGFGSSFSNAIDSWGSRNAAPPRPIGNPGPPQQGSWAPERPTDPGFFRGTPDDPNLRIGGGPAPYNPYPSMPPSSSPSFPSAPPSFPSYGPSMPPSYPPPPPGATAPPSYGLTTGPIGDPGAQGGPTILDRYPRGTPPPPSPPDPLTGLSSQAMNAGGGGPLGPDDGPIRQTEPTPTPTPTPAAPTPTTPTPTTPITVPHQPDAPMIPGTPVIPGRGRSVTHPGPPPDAGGSGAAPVPNPTPPSPSLAGQNNGQPLPPGATGENASDLAMRWKQALAATDPQLANNVTPLMVAFFRENNPNGLDPVAWMKTPGNLDAFNRYVAANPQGGPVGSLNVGPLDQYHPQAPHTTGAGAPPPSPSGTPPTPTPTPTPPGGTPPAPPSPLPPGVPNESGFGPTLQSTPGGGAPTPPAPGAPPPDNTAVMQNAQGYLRQLLNPEFANEQRDLSRNMNAQAALTGDTQSGGFGEEAGRAQGNLIGQQGSRLTDYLTQATEADKSRQLQQHIADIQNTTANKQIDSNLAIAQLNDSTTRYGIKTNDDLQRFLNDKNNVLAKYGIDSQAVSARYAAEQQAAGQAASGNAAYNAALLNSAVSKEIASMNNDTQRRANQQQYDLGVLGINATNYRADQSNLLAYLQSLLGNAPGQITTPPTGGYVPYGP